MTGEGEDMRWAAAVRHVAYRVTGPPLPEDLDVTVHFHPDRLVGTVPLLRHLATDGVYRSQFETGTSNGGLTAHAGGGPGRWEHPVVGGGFHPPPPPARPKDRPPKHPPPPARWPAPVRSV